MKKKKIEQNIPEIRNLFSMGIISIHDNGMFLSKKKKKTLMKRGSKKYKQ